MDYSGGYFNSYVNNIYKDLGQLYDCMTPEGDSYKVREEGGDKLTNLHAIFNQTQQVSKHLQDLDWCVTVLDPEVENKVLVAAFHALNKVNEGILDLELSLKNVIDSPTSSLEEKGLAQTNLQKLKELRRGYEETVVTTHEKMNDSGGINELIKEPLIKSHTSEQKKQGILKSIWNTTYYSLASAAGMAGSMVYRSKPIGEYYETVDRDVPERKDYIISMLNGEKMATELVELHNSRGSVSDKYGKFLKVPSVFAADLHRSRSLLLNQKLLFETQNPSEYNTNEVARALYREFGKEGAIRIMQLCNQGVKAYVLEKRIFPLLTEKWMQLFSPDKLLNPSQVSIKEGGGLAFDIVNDENENKVIITVKLLLKLHTEEEKKFTAHFISKTTIEIPFDELVRDEFPKNSSESNIHVEDVLSKVIINNPGEAKSLFRNF